MSEENTQETKVEEIETVNVEQEESKIEETRETEKINTLIYCGPSLPNGVLQQYSMFKNGLPEYLNDQFKACPAIKELFVSTTKLNATRQNMEIQGTRENTLLKKIMEYTRG
ncbi:hypothetical protein [Clostridium magnum]|uniref:Uncharacterized protein n=1 Tax=Clostridium magnum DSM 2767 TaxID=1121326 RepID=A0A161YF98_9CLOT|nr:hypothetical protein [Clostridium magnum]KZL88712.1 hypothetical protein CLMAG_60010 [Clostridium magnum DSM 2767]SHJ44190.1 hypothetical protein SAMN02745944_05969 [Clostridium magnum DSM 2767]